MKSIVIGDIHGNNVWQKIIEKETLNCSEYEVIFLGDYFDSFNISGLNQISNFKKILKFKQNNLDKVHLLLGNHDYHYLSGVAESYSGYQAYLRFDIEELFMNNLDLFKILYINNKFLFSHAGVSSVWMNEKGITLTQINDYLKYNYKIFGFSPGEYNSNYGNETCQGPLWIRPDSLRICYVPEYIHVVGHTHRDTITIDDKIILCDCLPNQYLVIENNICYAKDIT